MVKIVFEPGDVFECDGGYGVVIGDGKAVVFKPTKSPQWKLNMDIRMGKIPKEAFPAKWISQDYVVMCIKTVGVVLGIPVDWASLKQSVTR